VKLDVSVNNPNVFALKAKNIAYDLSIENNKWVKGFIPSLTDIPARGTAEFTIPVTLSYKEVGNTMFDMLKKNNPIDYKLRLSFRVEGGNSMVKDSKVILESDGSAKSVMKIAKKMKKDKKQ